MVSGSTVNIIHDYSRTGAPELRMDQDKTEWKKFQDEVTSLIYPAIELRAARVQHEYITHLDNVRKNIQGILDDRMVAGQQEYKIHWKGFKIEESTWEPDFHIHDEGMIRKYWEKKGLNRPTATTRRYQKQAAKRQQLRTPTTRSNNN